MKLTPAEVWSELRSTYWFVPSLMTVGGIALALAFQRVDGTRSLPPAWLAALRPFYPDSAEGARALLTAIVGSIITVVSITFSITIVALTVTSQHYGPRLLNTFMRDAPVQIVLGVFIGTFAYSVLVLGSVRGGEGNAAPHLSSLGSVLLVLVSVGALIHFIHHISSRMGAPSIASHITLEFLDAVHGTYAADTGDADAPDVEEAPVGEPGIVPCRESGYVQRVDEGALVELAARRDALFRLRRHPGDFATPGSVLIDVYPRTAVDDRLVREANEVYVLGLDRTLRHDPEFGLKQLVEVALHALSPSLNEPFTALTCIDRIAECLLAVARLPPPRRARCDASGRPRLIADRQTFAHLLRVSFDPIRVATGENPAVPVRMLDAIALIEPVVARQADRDALRHQADVIRRWSRERLRDPDDVLFLEHRYADTVARLGAPPAPRDG